MTEMTEEQLKQMSPEQIAEMQKQQCIFCQIISGKVNSRKVYEDDRCIAILDINPANPGHVLILPKEHYAIMPMMPEDEIRYIFKIAKKISKAQIKGLKADGTNIFIANGAAAGQKAPHFMIHVIPRKETDGITSFSLPKNQITGEDQDKLRRAIRQKVNAQFGIEETEPVMAERPAPEKVETDVKEPTPEEGEEAPAAETGAERPEKEEQHKEEKQEEEQPMFEFPAPEEEEHDAPEGGHKGGTDLDSISNLFK